MPELERLHGLRVVADPAALDTAQWHGENVTVLRFAPDDAFAFGAVAVDVDDEHAIVEAEAGFVGVWLPIGDLVPHLEWPLPAARPALAQGAVAGVPAKVWVPARGLGMGRDTGMGRDNGLGSGGDELALLLTAAAYGHELAGRLR